MPNNNIYEFDEFRLDCNNFTLHRGIEKIPLQPRVFDTLVYLVEHAGAIVTKNDLIHEVWSDAEVQDNALMRCVSLLRKVLDDAQGTKYIRTVPGKGYLFCATAKLLSIDVREQDLPPSQLPPPPQTSLSWLRQFDYPLVIVTLLLILGIGFVANVANKPPAAFKAIRLTSNSTDSSFLAAAISPNGNMIAFADDTGLLVSDVKTVERHSLPLPNGLLPSFIDWFPDGIHILVSINNSATHETTVWRSSVLGIPAELLLQNATKAVVSPDGLRIAFVRNNNELWLANTDGSSSVLFATVHDKIFTTRPQFSADSRSIITGSANSAFEHTSIEARYIGSGAIRTLFETDKPVVDFRLVGNDELIISWYPHLSSWSTQLVSVKISTGKAILPSLDELVEIPNYSITNISATHNGNAIAVINESLHSSIYVADLQANGTALSNIRRLTLNDSGNRPTAWLADSRTLLFHSDRSERYAIYRQAIDSINAHQMVNGELDSMSPVASADQRWLFYFTLESKDITSTTKAKLMRAPLTGGESQVIDADVDDMYSLHCARTVNRCILGSHVKDKTIYFEFDPEKGRGRELAQVPWKPGFGFYDWDVDADCRRIAYIDTASGTDVIGIITLSNQSSTLTHFYVSGQEPLRTLYWDAPGEGFYVTTHNNDHDELKLLHIAIDGSVHVLRQQLNSIEGLAIPSPDGKHLVFQKYIGQSNIWLLQRANST